MRVWYRFFPTELAENKASLIDVFQVEGIDPHHCEPTPSEPGIVIFDQPTRELYDFLRLTRASGIGRIIALGLSRSALPTPAAWKLLNAGACDVLSWDQPEQTAKSIAARLLREETLDILMGSPVVTTTLVSASVTGRRIIREIVEAAYFTDSTILLMGDSGTGKELAAHLIHALDQRQGKSEFITLDCTTIVPELSGSELFGHERGAFTGSIASRDGAFALANSGTLFLDEVGELPLTLQGQLLRAIQERSYKRVGGNTWHRSEFRLVCATNRDLCREVAEGRFRSDLYYRIAGRIFTMPPLRERTEDILPLVFYFIKQLKHDETSPPDLDDAVRECLMYRDYPGNIRDLKQLVGRLLARHTGPGPITAGDVPEDERPGRTEETRLWCDLAFEQSIQRAVAAGIGLKAIGKMAEDLAVSIAVTGEDGNLQRAAAKLKVTDRALQLRRASTAQWFSNEGTVTGQSNGDIP